MTEHRAELLAQLLDERGRQVPPPASPAPTDAQRRKLASWERLEAFQRRWGITADRKDPT